MKEKDYYLGYKIVFEIATTYTLTHVHTYTSKYTKMTVMMSNKTHNFRQ